jgi:hypothetical protein
MTDVDEAPTPVLPRELSDISDAVREVAAPPTPALAEPYRIRLVDPDADAVMISEWMNRPHGGGVGVRLAAGTLAAIPARPAWRASTLGRSSAASAAAISVISSCIGRQRIPSRRAMTPILMTSHCTPPSQS